MGVIGCPLDSKIIFFFEIFTLIAFRLLHYGLQFINFWEECDLRAVIGK